MALTVAQVAGLADLGLVVRTSGVSLDGPVRWVAVSELPDPAPWLDGGELLLTTGMSIADDAKSARAYIDRLVSADVAALGFGVGINHAQIPPTLLKAAEKAGLPILEIPAPLPFVAVGKAVLRQLTADEYAESAASFEAQRKLIRSALESDGADIAPGVAGIVARHVSGFALVLGSDGALRAGHPQAAGDRIGDFLDEVDRLRPRGVLASSSLVTAEEHVVILPLGTGRPPSGFLVVGTASPVRAFDQSVINLAVSVLTWHGARPPGVQGDPQQWRFLALEAALNGSLTPDRARGLGLGSLIEDQVRAVYLRGDDVAEAVTLLDESGFNLVAVASNRAAWGFIADVPDEVLARIGAMPGIAALGVSESGSLMGHQQPRTLLHQAEQAASGGRGLRHAGRDGRAGLGRLVEADALRAWAEAYAGELAHASHGVELRETLKAWLARNGQVDAAASDLGIHRHTVRHRLRRIEGVLEVDLDDPGVRANLWLALSALDT